MPPLRLALVGAFPFPHHQGSQVFAAQQARALVEQGARATLLCYGRGSGPGPADLEVVRIPRALSPRSLRAGPSPGKPVADAALAAAYVALRRRRRFDAALAHNAEAALVALAARRAIGVPVVYVAHTLLGAELSAYAPAALGPASERLGARLDRLLARAADAVVCLGEAAARALRPHARGPVEVIPPGLEPAPPPDPSRVETACARAGLEPGGYALYAGNPDRYQDLDALEEAARLTAVPVAVVTHAEPPASWRALRAVRADDFAQVRALTWGAALALLPRRRSGGFPIKLLNYMDAGRAIVAHAGVAEGLEHDRSAWLLPDDAGPDALAGAIEALCADPAHAERLGRAARLHLAARHAWPALARRTLALAERVAGGRGGW